MLGIFLCIISAVQLLIGIALLVVGAESLYRYLQSW